MQFAWPASHAQNFSKLSVVATAASLLPVEAIVAEDSHGVAECKGYRRPGRRRATPRAAHAGDRRAATAHL
jgi:hypothetical protein